MSYGKKAQECDCFGGYCLRRHCPHSDKNRKRRREEAERDLLRRPKPKSGEET